MTAPNAPLQPEEEKPLDPAAERVRRKLVRFMGINLGILFAAVMAVVLALVYKSLSPEEPDAAGPTGGMPSVPSGEVLSGDILLPAGAQVLSHSVSGRRLALHLRLEDGGEAFHLYDLVEARPIGRFRLVREGS